MGSVNIDEKFEQLALKKLEKLGHERLGLRSTREFPRIAWRMRHSEDFQNEKVTLGATQVHPEEAFYVKMVGASVPNPDPADEVQVANTDEMRFR